MSDDRRNETQLLCDIIGIESLVDEITYKLAADAMDQPTATAVLGPFWRKDAPRLQMGESVIIKDMSKGDKTVDYAVMARKLVQPTNVCAVDAWHGYRLQDWEAHSRCGD